jgi:hypothetical protein
MARKEFRRKNPWHLNSGTILETSIERYEAEALVPQPVGGSKKTPPTRRGSKYWALRAKRGDIALGDVNMLPQR